MTSADFKYLPRLTISDKVLHNKAFNIAKDQKYDFLDIIFGVLI